MTFFYNARWQNPYHPQFHHPAVRGMYGLGAVSDQQVQQQAGAHNFTAEQQAIAKEIEFFMRQASLMAFSHPDAAKLSNDARNFILAWQQQGAKFPAGLLNVNPMVGGQAGENTGYDVLHTAYDTIAQHLDKMTDNDEKILNAMYPTIMQSSPVKPAQTANIFGLIDNFGDLTNAYHDVYFQDTNVEKKPTRRFGWGKWLLWGGAALCGVLLIAAAVKGQNKSRF